MEKNIATLPGDGIGPEIMHQALNVLRAIEEKYGHTFNLTSCPIGAAAIKSSGQPLPIETLDHCLQSDAVLLAAIGEPAYDNNPNLSMRPEQGLLGLRKAMKLHANIRPIKTTQALSHLSQLKSITDTQIDMVIYRELSSGIYYGQRSEGHDTDEARDECYYNKTEIERISIPAFEAAQLRKGKLCLVDKANVLATSRLWRRVVNGIASKYPDVELSHLYVDNAAMQMVLNPSQFDVILCGNMFGDIISDLASTIPGSIGLLASASLGPNLAMFEPVHGSYPQAAGENTANPIAMIRSVAMMLNHFGLNKEAQTIEDGIQYCLSQGFGTEDLAPKNKLSTTALGNHIVSFIKDGKISPVTTTVDTIISPN